MQVYYYKGERVADQRNLNIPDLYRKVTGKELDVSEWRKNGKLDGMDITDWYEANGVEKKTEDSIWSFNH